jgi:hypothetical protein
LHSFHQLEHLFNIPVGEPVLLQHGETAVAGPLHGREGTHGVFTHSNVGKPGAPDEERQRLNAAIWRYHPTRHEFEVFAHGTSNPWGIDFDDHGQAFATACVIPHLFHIIQGARYHRQAGSHFNAHTYADIPTIADHRHYVGSNPHAGNAHSGDVSHGMGPIPKIPRKRLMGPALVSKSHFQTRATAAHAVTNGMK